MCVISGWKLNNIWSDDPDIYIVFHAMLIYVKIDI